MTFVAETLDGDVAPIQFSIEPRERPVFVSPADAAWLRTIAYSVSFLSSRICLTACRAISERRPALATFSCVPEMMNVFLKHDLRQGALRLARLSTAACCHADETISSPFRVPRASTRLSVLPFGIVVTPSPSGAWLGIVHMGCPPSSRGFILRPKENLSVVSVSNRVGCRAVRGIRAFNVNVRCGSGKAVAHNVLALLSRGWAIYHSWYVALALVLSRFVKAQVSSGYKSHMTSSRSSRLPPPEDTE
jgi:hypothetical protein